MTEDTDAHRFELPIVYAIQLRDWTSQDSNLGPPLAQRAHRWVRATLSGPSDASSRYSAGTPLGARRLYFRTASRSEVLSQTELLILGHDESTRQI